MRLPRQLKYSTGMVGLQYLYQTTDKNGDKGSACVCVRARGCVFLQLLYTEYQNTLSTSKARTFFRRGHFVPTTFEASGFRAGLKVGVRIGLRSGSEVS